MTEIPTPPPSRDALYGALYGIKCTIKLLKEQKRDEEAAEYQKYFNEIQNYLDRSA